LNISSGGLTTEQVIDAGKKWTYYSPYILPFSYSSPFYKGGLWGEGETWGGYSIRTYQRTGRRPAAMVFLEYKHELIKSSPSLTKIARVEREAGRIEFKAFDSCGDFSLYAALLALLKGLLLDKTLEGRAFVPDAEQHQLSARWAFDDDWIYDGAREVFEAARAAIADDPEAGYLGPLEAMLEERVTPAHGMIERLEGGNSIEDILVEGYQ
jgi:hypothetical protein